MISTATSQMAAQQVSTLPNEFEQLKQSARSLDDLHAWFTAHPEILVGDLVLPANSKMTLRLKQYSSGLLAHVAKTGSFPVSMNCEITSAYQPNLLLSKETHSADTLQAIYFKHAQNLNLDLLDWPLATVLIITDCIDVLDAYANRDHFAEYEYRVNKALAKHFGDFTLAKLKALYDADLLPKDTHGIVIAPALVDMLYSTLKTNVEVTMPMELS